MEIMNDVLCFSFVRDLYCFFELFDESRYFVCDCIALQQDFCSKCIYL